MHHIIAIILPCPEYQGLALALIRISTVCLCPSLEAQANAVLPYYRKLHDDVNTLYR